MSKKINRPINPRTGKEFSRSWTYRKRHPEVMEAHRILMRTPKALEMSSIRTIKNKEHLRIVKRNYYQNNKIRLARITRENRKDIVAKAHNISTWNYKKKDNCEICNSKDRLQTHHWNYNKPLMVSILCRTCHKIQHVKNFPRWQTCKLAVDNMQIGGLKI